MVLIEFPCAIAEKSCKFRSEDIMFLMDTFWLNPQLEKSLYALGMSEMPSGYWVLMGEQQTCLFHRPSLVLLFLHPSSLYLFFIGGQEC